MQHFLLLLWGTLCLRPYVFAFLGAYLVIAALHLGLGRALVFLALGYVVAWTMEFSSIHTGFPFGWYYYIPATRDQELWVGGVPFMDSLSYVFLAYAGYTLALLALGPEGRAGWDYPLVEERRRLLSWRPTLLGAVLVMTLDVVIDPVALRGYRWFLGQMYGYPEPGWYFGIPLANFAGWLLVAGILIRLVQTLWAYLPSSGVWGWGRCAFPGRALLGPGLYLGILGFNLAVTWWIGEYTLLLAGCFMYLPFLTWLGLRTAGKDGGGGGQGPRAPAPSPTPPPPTP
jgi:uncharacterized membrane protein